MPVSFRAPLSREMADLSLILIRLFMALDDPPALEASVPKEREESVPGGLGQNVKLELPAPPPKPAGVGRLIASRTTDLLAIAIVVVGSLTVGRQMLQWWHKDPPAVLDVGPIANLSTEWGADGRPVSLEFGRGPYRMTRQVFTTGGSQAALDSVRLQCQQILVDATSPGTGAERSELEQLKVLDTLRPELEQPGNWQLYLLDGRLAMVVGVKLFNGRTEKTEVGSPPANRRVICWGLVFPGLSHGSWTAYLFERTAVVSERPVAADSGSFDLGQIALPPGCQRTVLMQEADVSGLLGFQGTGDDNDWQRHFTQGLEKQGWKLADAWQVQGAGHVAKFVCRQAGRSDESTLQIHFDRQSTGQGSGLIHWLPGRESPPELAPTSPRGTP